MNTKTVLFIAILSALLYGISAALRLFEKTKKTGVAVWVCAVLTNAILVANNWILNGYVPFVSMYQVLTFLSLTFAFVYLYVKFVLDGGWMDKYFCVLPSVCLIGVCFMGVDDKWHFPPALQSPWFIPHILVYMIAYSLCAVAFILTVISFFNKTDKKLLETGCYNLVCIAFPFLTAGMLFGAIWANEVWGNFWSFDIKENWALVSWLMFTIYLHFRRNAKLQKFSKYFVIFGFIAVITTMFFVNFMNSSSQHTYS